MLCGSRYYIKLANTLNCIHKVSSRYLIQHPPTCSYCRAELRYLGFTHLSSDPRNTVNVLMPIVFRLFVPIVKYANNAIVLCLLEHCDCLCLSRSLLSSSPLPLSSFSSPSSSLFNIVFLHVVQVKLRFHPNCLNLISSFHYICAGRTFSIILKMPYINGVYMASRAPRSPRRFAPRAIIPQHGRLLQHHDIPNPRPAIPPRALSADLMNNELESYLHVREARDHVLTANGKPYPEAPPPTQPP